MKERLIFIVAIMILSGLLVYQYTVYNSDVAGFQDIKRIMEREHAENLADLEQDQAAERENLAIRYESMLADLESQHSAAQEAREAEFEATIGRIRADNAALVATIRELTRETAVVQVEGDTVTTDKETVVSLVACCKRGENDLADCREDCERKLLQQESDLKQARLSDVQALEMALEKERQKNELETARANTFEKEVRAIKSSQWWKYLLTAVGGAGLGAGAYAIAVQVKGW